MRLAAMAMYGVSMVAAATDFESTHQSSGVTSRLRGVSAVSERVAWASGAAGTILRTVDGGKTWERRGIPDTEKLDFRDIDAFDERTAYVLSIGPGGSSRIYKTTDGGENWTLQFKNPDPKAFFDAMTFWSPERGIAVSDSVDGQFVLIITNDGGRTWRRVDAKGLPPALPNEGAFAASGSNIAVEGTKRVWIGLGSGRVLYSTDGGKKWNLSVTGVASSATAGVFSIAFRDKRHGVVVGGDYKAESIASNNGAVTRDGGLNWKLVGGLKGLRSAVTWLPGSSPRILLAVGPLGLDVSKDDGVTWNPEAGSGFHAFSAARSGKSGWGVGEGGRIASLQWK